MGWLALGMKLFPFIVEAVNWVEKFITEKGRRKQDAAVYMVKATLGLVEQGTGRDLLDDEEVEEATRKVIDAIVLLNNLVTKKSNG
jgi:hypothetical protein|tara:strand:- start:3267 stop:3524 length:258 start_codon:yes stop_codon:yes gene_type:complete